MDIAGTNSNTKGHIVQVREVTKVYKMGAREVHALRGVDMALGRGEFLSIMGRSGSGKSTLLNMIGCLDQPSSGTIVLDGTDLSSARYKDLPFIRRDKVGFVFQQHNLISTLTAIENVMLPLGYAQVPRRRAAERARELLALVGLQDRTSHLPSELSGGEQARVAIARALANNPSVVLADEPTGELDSHTARQVIGLMAELNQAASQTFVVVTHDPIVAEATHRTLFMVDGRIEEEKGNASG